MCGGEAPGVGIVGSCYGYDIKTDTWSALGEMPEPKGRAASAYDVHWGIVMAGGEAVKGAPTDTVFETMDGIFFNQLERLPVPSRDSLA